MSRSEMDTPDLSLAGLSIWVDGRQFPEATDYWDANWLRVRVRMQAGGATVRCSGSILMTTDVFRFRQELEELRARIAGQATLSGLEPELTVELTMHSLGHIESKIEITPDHVNQYHWFTLELDQSYLPELIGSCDAILARYPVVGAGRFGL